MIRVIVTTDIYGRRVVQLWIGDWCEAEGVLAPQ